MKYNIFHKKNSVQSKIIDSKNYTYQYLINLTSKYMKKCGEVLDVGCGVGAIDLFLANKGHRVQGMDISDLAIQIAKQSQVNSKMDNVVFEVGDVKEMKVKKKFDYVICSEVIEHVYDDNELLENLNLSLKSKGLLFLSTPLVTAPLYKWGFLEKFDQEVGHLRRYSTADLISRIRLAGFEIVEIEKIEGVIRNGLYTIKPLGFLLKFVKWPFSLVVNLVDTISLRLFGASNVFIVARKK